MQYENIKQDELKAVDYIVFTTGNMHCGINILDVQEIKKLSNITPVYHAPEYVRGIVNMRGHIITLIDIRNLLGLPAVTPLSSSLAIIVPFNEELIGILVEEVEDIVSTTSDLIEPPPSNMHIPEKQFISGILKLDNKLIAIVEKNSICMKNNKSINPQ